MPKPFMYYDTMLELGPSFKESSAPWWCYLHHYGDNWKCKCL